MGRLILDTSAIVEVILEGPECENLRERLEGVEDLAVGTPTVVEAGLVLTARLGADGNSFLYRFLDEWKVHSIPFSDDHAREAVRAFRRYGKGRHPASLNFGDCMTFATAKLAGQALLSVGHDFEKTDLDHG